MIRHIDPDAQELQGLILAPTRELAIQIGDELRGLLTFSKNIRAWPWSTAARDRDARSSSFRNARRSSLPRRDSLADHYKRKTLRLDKIRTVILDEADRMLDMGFSTM